MLEPCSRLLLVLQWLRHYTKFIILKIQYQVSKSFISRDIKHILPILYTTLHYIHLPQKEEWIGIGKFNTHAAIDCTAHYRWRVHPGQANYYRGDKHAHMLTAQILITRKPKRLASVILGLGHNNDQGMLRLTETDTLIEKNNLLLLGDGGYHHHRIITPSKVPLALEQAQKDERSAVEVVIGLAKTFEAAALTFRQSPELQELALGVIYELTQIKLDESIVFE